MAKTATLPAKAEQQLPSLPAGMANRFESMDSSDLVLPVAHLFQGLPSEAKIYGRHEPGDIIHSLTNEKIENNLFVPISAYKEWIRWKGDGTGFEYSTRVKSEVPPEDLQYGDDQPPAATEYHNWIVVFQEDQSPCVLRCKSTALRASKTLFTLEQMRAKRGPGLYEFANKEKSGKKGDYRVPEFRAKGDPSPELLSRAIELYTSLQGQTVTTTEAKAEEQGSGTFDPDAD